MIVEVDRVAGELRKRAESPVDGSWLAHEAKVLELARHPGVVELVGHEGDTLRLRLVDGQTLSEAGAPTDQELARIALGAATTLADLHDIGIVHRRLGSEHLLIDERGRPVLCGFREAAVGPVSDRDAFADVSALVGALPRDRAATAVALAVAAQLRRRPHPSRGLATRLATGLSTHPVASPATCPTPRPHRPPAIAALTKVSLTKACLAVAALAVAALAATALVAATGNHGDRIQPTSLCPPVDRGCGPLSHPAGGLDGPAGRYRIGQPTDVVVLGRWHCRGALPGLLRPGTGDIWVWDRWANGPAPEAARLVARVPRARSVRTVPAPSGCDQLRVTSGDGTVVVVRPDPPA